MTLSTVGVVCVVLGAVLAVLVLACLVLAKKCSSLNAAVNPGAAPHVKI